VNGGEEPIGSSISMHALSIFTVKINVDEEGVSHSNIKNNDNGAGDA